MVIPLELLSDILCDLRGLYLFKPQSNAKDSTKSHKGVDPDLELVFQALLQVRMIDGYQL